MNWTKVELRLNQSRNSLLILLQFELNQSGIETPSGGLPPIVWFFYEVWIEPKWNWDVTTSIESKLYPFIPFELNQSGIETINLLLIRFYYPLCLNWTKVELRPKTPEPISYLLVSLNWTKVELIQDRKERIYILDVLSVWIEPKWNWYVTKGSFPVASSSRFELNQSGIDTYILYFKTSLDGEYCLNWTKVELRQVCIPFLFRLLSFLFELNQSGIDTYQHMLQYVEWTLLFELNQSGIDTLSL